MLLHGTRPLAVPGRGHVLCASTGLVFNLADGEAVKPARWYEAVTQNGAPLDVPDPMVPLPGAEVLLLGPLPAVAEEGAEASLRCGELRCHLRLNPDPDAPGQPWFADHTAALWHDEHNPGGRGGPDDRRKPLIESVATPDQPIWLGQTPFEHPVRARRVGMPDASSGSGWPRNAEPTALNEAHQAFWTRQILAGDPLELTGFGGSDVMLTIPSYRAVTVTSRLPEGDWQEELVRIHGVSLLPAAGLGVIFWRSAIDLGDDVLGEKVGAVVIALEDIDTPGKDLGDLAQLAARRWDEPEFALDDRPLLPRKLAATVELPFATPENKDAMAERREAADAWVREEAGVGDMENPFSTPEAVEQFEQAAEEDEPPDLDDMEDLVKATLAAGKERHTREGFEPLTEDQQRQPVRRGDALAGEIETRLARPYQAPRETAITREISASRVDTGLAPDEMLEKLTEARMISSDPPLSWPALEEDEALVFGERVLERLREANVGRHVDLAGAIIGTPPGSLASGEQPDAAVVQGRVFEETLLEFTVWQGVTFENCVFQGATLVSARFEHCVFQDCEFEKVNFSRLVFEHAEFVGCELRECNGEETTWMHCRYDDCTIQKTQFVEPAIRDTVFVGGSWQELIWIGGLTVDTVLRGVEMNEVTYNGTHAPTTTFESVTMFKVWVMALGFPLSTFKDVEGDTCGFLSECHFDESRFERCRFVKTGFTSAVFKEAVFTPGCVFAHCDFSAAAFLETQFPEIRFLNCSMATSLWQAADASGGWFMGSILRGVNFQDTQLTGAVFVDADVEGMVCEDDKTIGADFRGTARAEL